MAGTERAGASGGGADFILPDASAAQPTPDAASATITYPGCITLPCANLECRADHLLDGRLPRATIWATHTH